MTAESAQKDTNIEALNKKKSYFFFVQNVQSLKMCVSFLFRNRSEHELRARKKKTEHSE